MHANWGGANMTRQEHLERCKKRALEYVDQGDFPNAYASMASVINFCSWDIDMRRTIRAQRECTQWLGVCLKLGWRKSDLDELEKLWWKWHDDNGSLIERSPLKTA